MYVNDLQVSWASATTLTVDDGQARDSTNTIDMALDELTTLNTAVNGANGLDAGDLANDTWYAVHLIGSSHNFAQPAVLLSLSTTAPTMPVNYDAFRHIGWMLTDGSANLLKNYISGNGNYRYNVWDANISVLTSGVAETLTAIDLSGAIPPIDNTPVQLEVNFTPATANDTVSFAPFGSTATLLPHIAGSVAAKINSGQLKVMSRLDTATPKILYINSAASGDADVWVSGFEYFI